MKHKSLVREFGKFGFKPVQVGDYDPRINQTKQWRIEAHGNRIDWNEHDNGDVNYIAIENIKYAESFDRRGDGSPASFPRTVGQAVAWFLSTHANRCEDGIEIYVSSRMTYNGPNSYSYEGEVSVMSRDDGRLKRIDKTWKTTSAEDVSWLRDCETIPFPVLRDWVEDKIPGLTAYLMTRPLAS